MEWWVTLDGEASDEPYSKEEIRDHTDIGPETRVRREGADEWIPASEDPELASIFEVGEGPSETTTGMDELENRLRKGEGSSSRVNVEGWGDWFQSLPGVFKEIVVAPGDFFANQRTVSVGFSIFYAIVLNMLIQLSTILYAATGTMNTFRNVESQQGLPWMIAHPEVFMLLVVVLFPVLVPILMYVGGGILHLILKLFGWDHSPYTETVKLVGFLSTSYVANLVPFIGGILGFFWGIVLQVIGLREIHNLTTGKALLVVFLPLLVGFGIIIVIAFFVALGPVLV